MTRAMACITDGMGINQWVYRNSDGYPGGVQESLTKLRELCERYRLMTCGDGIMGATVASLWLQILGVIEYNGVGDERFAGLKNFDSATEKCKLEIEIDLKWIHPNVSWEAWKYKDFQTDYVYFICIPTGDVFCYDGEFVPDTTRECTELIGNLLVECKTRKTLGRGWFHYRCDGECDGWQYDNEA